MPPFGRRAHLGKNIKEAESKWAGPGEGNERPKGIFGRSSTKGNEKPAKAKAKGNPLWSGQGTSDREPPKRRATEQVQPKAKEVVSKQKADLQPVKPKAKAEAIINKPKPKSSLWGGPSQGASPVKPNSASKAAPKVQNTKSKLFEGQAPNNNVTPPSTKAKAKDIINKPKPDGVLSSKALTDMQKAPPGKVEANAAIKRGKPKGPKRAKIVEQRNSPVRPKRPKPKTDLSSIISKPTRDTTKWGKGTQEDTVTAATTGVGKQSPVSTKRGKFDPSKATPSKGQYGTAGVNLDVTRKSSPTGNVMPSKPKAKADAIINKPKPDGVLKSKSVAESNKAVNAFKERHGGGTKELTSKEKWVASREKTKAGNPPLDSTKWKGKGTDTGTGSLAKTKGGDKAAPVSTKRGRFDPSKVEPSGGLYGSQKVDLDLSGKNKTPTPGNVMPTKSKAKAEAIVNKPKPNRSGLWTGPKPEANSVSGSAAPSGAGRSRKPKAPVSTKSNTTSAVQDTTDWKKGTPQGKSSLAKPKGGGKSSTVTSKRGRFDPSTVKTNGGLYGNQKVDLDLSGKNKTPTPGDVMPVKAKAKADAIINKPKPEGVLNRKSVADKVEANAAIKRGKPVRPQRPKIVEQRKTPVRPQRPKPKTDLSSIISKPTRGNTDWKSGTPRNVSSTAKAKGGAPSSVSTASGKFDPSTVKTPSSGGMYNQPSTDLSVTKKSKPKVKSVTALPVTDKVVDNMKDVAAKPKKVKKLTEVASTVAPYSPSSTSKTIKKAKKTGVMSRIGKGLSGMSGKKKLGLGAAGIGLAGAGAYAATRKKRDNTKEAQVFMGQKDLTTKAKENSKGWKKNPIKLIYNFDNNKQAKRIDNA